MFKDVMEEVTSAEAEKMAADEAAERQALVNEVMADQFATGSEEQRLAMAFLGGLFSFFSRYPAELIPESYVEAYEVMYGDLPAHTKALLGSLIGFVASGFDSSDEQRDLILAMAQGQQRSPGADLWSEAYDAENAHVVLVQDDYDAIFERFAREKYAGTAEAMGQFGLVLGEVKFEGGEVWLGFDVDDGEGPLDLVALAETLAIEGDAETMAAIEDGLDELGGEA